MPNAAAKEPIWSGTATVVRVTPPDYSTLGADADTALVKADVTLRSDAFAGEWHFPIDRSRILEFDALAAKRGTVTITVAP